MVRAGSNPLSVLGGIQLCGLPGALAEIIVPLFGLCPHGTTVSFRTRNLSISASSCDLDWISFLFCSQPSLIALLSAVIFPRGQRSFLRSSPRPARLLVPILLHAGKLK